MKIAFFATAAMTFALPAAAQQTPAPTPSAVQFPLTRTDVQARVQARFAQRDANHDGFMTSAELGENAAGVIARLDTDHDGKVSLAEASARTLADFDAADADHDGNVTQEEANAMMAGPPPAPATPATPTPH